MRLLDKLRGLLHRESTAPVDHQRHDLTTAQAKAGRTEAMKRAIAENPSAFSRATRRLYGFYGRAVPIDWVQPESSVFVPRYIRRHARLSSKATTRRQRKQVARMTRLIARYDLKAPGQHRIGVV